MFCDKTSWQNTFKFAISSPDELLVANYYRITRSTQMDSCSLARCGSLIITSQLTFCHVCLLSSNTFNTCFHQMQLALAIKRRTRHVDASPISRTESHFFLQSVFLHSLSKSLWNVDLFPRQVCRHFPPSRRLKSTWRHSKLDSSQSSLHWGGWLPQSHI